MYLIQKKGSNISELAKQIILTKNEKKKKTTGY